MSHLIDHLQRVSAAGAASPGQSGVRGEYSAQTDETRSARSMDLPYRFSPSDTGYLIWYKKFNLVNQIPDVEL